MTDFAIAAATGIPASAVAAIRKVESGGRTNAVRFEPHLFLRDRPDLASRIPYTPGATRAASSVAAETNRAAFERAFALDPAVAVRSTSWGAFQVLGGPLLAMASTPAAAVARFDAAPMSVSDQLLIEWLTDRPSAIAAARAGDWQRFVELYNGCSGAGCDRYLTKFRNALGSSGAGIVDYLVIAGISWWLASKWGR